MKVDVLTAEDVKIKKYHWWSSWIDIAVFDYSCEPYLIQMKVSRNNSKRFKSVNITGIQYRQTTAMNVGNLTHMKPDQP